MQAYLLTFLFPFPLPISGNIEKQPNMACYDFSAQNTGELGVFCSIGKGGIEVLFFMGQGIFFGLLSLRQVLLSHPSLSDLRITRNHLLLSGWICLFVPDHELGKGLWGNPKAQPFPAHNGQKCKSGFDVQSWTWAARCLFVTGRKLGLLCLTECCRTVG